MMEKCHPEYYKEYSWMKNITKNTTNNTPLIIFQNSF